MRYHHQNLNESRTGEVIGSILFHGRAWWNRFHWEWLTFHKARGFAATITFGGGDNDDGLMLHACLPFIFSIYFGIAGVFRCKTCKTGVAIHNQAFWLYLLPYEMESNSSDPWYRRNISWSFPWQLDWYSTEVLTLHTTELAKAVWREQRGDRKRKCRDVFETMAEREKFQNENSETHNYLYVLKSGEIQRRWATIYVDRMEWRARWYPLIPIRKVATSINVKFNEEVGEGTGSWKGGCTGCGYDMLPNETPAECLRRMEQERKFSR